MFVLKRHRANFLALIFCIENQVIIRRLAGACRTERNNDATVDFRGCGKYQRVRDLRERVLFWEVPPGAKIANVRG